MKVRDYKEPKVWQRTFELTKEIYMVTKGFPEDEKYGLTSHIRRAAVPVPSNIAEGANRGSTKEFPINLLGMHLRNGAGHTNRGIVNIQPICTNIECSTRFRTIESLL